MKLKTFSVLPIFLLTPLILNTPPKPIPTVTEYDQLENGDLHVELDDNDKIIIDGYYYYNVTIENKTDKYIQTQSLYFVEEHTHKKIYFDYVYGFQNRERLKQFIYPYESARATIKNDSVLLGIDKGCIYGCSYVLEDKMLGPDSITLETTGIMGNKRSEEKDPYYYYVTADMSDYVYKTSSDDKCILIQMNYEGTTYWFEFEYDSNNVFKCISYIDIDCEKAEILEGLCANESYKVKDPHYEDRAKANASFMTGLIVSLHIAFVIIAGGIIALIVFIIRKIVKAARGY